MAKSLYSQKDIVLVPFPFTHFDAEKIRPALIISPINKYGDYVVLFITSQVDKYLDDKNNVYIKQNEINNLASDSVIICTKFATLSESMLIKKLGSVSTADWAKVKKSIKNVLGV